MITTIPAVVSSGIRRFSNILCKTVAIRSATSYMMFFASCKPRSRIFPSSQHLRMSCLRGGVVEGDKEGSCPHQTFTGACRKISYGKDVFNNFFKFLTLEKYQISFFILFFNTGSHTFHSLHKQLNFDRMSFQLSPRKKISDLFVFLVQSYAYIGTSFFREIFGFAPTPINIWPSQYRDLKILIHCLAFNVVIMSMGVKKTLLLDGQSPVLASNVLAQFCGPKAKEEMGAIDLPNQ